jgi:hypothetical protein
MMAPAFPFPRRKKKFVVTMREAPKPGSNAALGC